MFTIRSSALAAAVLLSGLASTFGAQAATIEWNTWTSTTTGSITTSGAPIGVSFAGPSIGIGTNYDIYSPTSSYADGVIVDNAPLVSNSVMDLTGGSNASNTVTFGAAVLNPVMAIWSLGGLGVSASFVFSNAVPTFVAGGPNSGIPNGQSIVVSGNTVTGTEGNGTVEFIGTFTSISWTNPLFENYYGFNVGVPTAAASIPPVAAVPEPQSWALMIGGLSVLGGLARLRRRT